MQNGPAFPASARGIQHHALLARDCMGVTFEGFGRVEYVCRGVGSHSRPRARGNSQGSQVCAGGRQQGKKRSFCSGKVRGMCMPGGEAVFEAYGRQRTENGGFSPCMNSPVGHWHMHECGSRASTGQAHSRGVTRETGRAGRPRARKHHLVPGSGRWAARSCLVCCGSLEGGADGW